MRFASPALPLTLLAALAVAAPAAAQATQESTLTRQPIGRFVADVRASFPSFPDDAAIAGAIGVTADNLPGRTIGLVAGAHWYPARLKRLTIGIGGEWTTARNSETLQPATADADAGPTVNARFSALSPQVSLNFGARDGWSYVSGGLGWSSFTVENAASPVPDADSGVQTINYGGGARWFARPHVAFSFDVRFYRINAQAATAVRPAYPRLTMVVMSAGVAFK